MQLRTLLSLFFSFSMAACFAQEDTLNYLFLGHTYQWKSAVQKVDFRLEAIDKSPYDQFWLGGDNCSETAQSYTTLQYLDSIFHLANPKNHWTLGNHDHRNGNMEWIEEFTQRNDYYTSHQDGITVMVLNTNLNPSDCENLNKQYQMISNVCDTIQESSHLIILNHHFIWSKLPEISPQEIGSHGVIEYYAMNCDSTNALFHNTMYPKLISVQERGVQVINIMGDAGWGDPTAKQTSEGIWFMASGINATVYDDNPVAFEASADEILVIRHIPKQKKLWWEYLSLDELYEE
ncbi:MAG: hypothetical protein ACI8YQ_001804 [Polaribacter sp.]|jgi:hypothetical protein